MTRTTTLFTGLAAAALLAAPAIARPHGPPPFHGDGAMRAIGAMLHGGELSDAQRSEARQRLDISREAAEPTMEALREANEALTALLLGSETPSDDALRSAIERITTLRDQLLDNQVDAALTLRGLLSSEQLAAAGDEAEHGDVFMPRP